MTLRQGVSKHRETQENETGEAEKDLAITMGLVAGKEISSPCAPTVCSAPMITNHGAHNAPWESGSVIPPFADDSEVPEGSVTGPRAHTGACGGHLPSAWEVGQNHFFADREGAVGASSGSLLFRGCSAP